MSKFLLITDNPKNWSFEIPDATVVSSREYLSNGELYKGNHYRVLNMCRSYRYQRLGYYVSLLAEIRGHRPLPSIKTILDFKSQTIIKSLSEDLNNIVQSALKNVSEDRFTLSIYFAQNMNKSYERLCRALFNLFPSPFLRAQFLKTKTGWTIDNISPVPSSEVPQEHRPFVMIAGQQFFSKSSDVKEHKKKHSRYSLAILTDASEQNPPSSPKALENFVKAASRLDIGVKFITPDDIGMLNEFDGLFIRKTTAVNNATYRMSRKAEALGLVVMDDPVSILRCSNKVFLKEILSEKKVPTPKTVIIHKDNVADALRELGLPCILKQPDSAFSLGVFKVENEKSYFDSVDQLMEKSDLIIGQEFVPTDYDWRIGIVDKKPLYACKYFMARNHWQIYNHTVKGDDETGIVETVAIEEAPKKVVKVALQAANAIGDGLYGVDIKVLNGNPVVIEVNDNPSIDAGIEDIYLKERLYLEIMKVFLQRMEENASIDF